MELRCATTRVSGRAVVDDLPIGTTLFAIGGERTEITEKECDGGNLKVVGALTAVGYFGSDGKFFTRKLETPFDCTLDCAFSCDTDIDIVLKPQKAKGKIITLTEIEIEAEMLFDIYPTEKFKTRFVKGIKVTGEKQMNEYALSVYIPTEGEELWSLAKRLNVCPDVLVETNKELCFPLTGKERIVIYRQKR